MTDKHIYLDKEGLKHVVDHLEASVTAETRRATGAEENLQEQIETIHTAQNCVDIVATYSELLELDTSILRDNDKVEVLADETHEGNVYIYRLSKQEGEEPEWTAVGSMISVGDSWKQWSKDNGSSAVDDTSIHIGANTEINGSHDVAIGNSNTVGETSDNTVILGNANSVEYDADAEHSSQTATAVIGDKNIVSGTRYTGEDMTYFSGAFGTENNVSGEGVAIGKHNTVTEFGTALGQNLTADKGSVAIGGEGASAKVGAIAMGNGGVNAENGAIVIGHSGSKATNGSLLLGGNNSTAMNGSLGLLNYGSTLNNGSIGLGFNVHATDGSTALGTNFVNAERGSNAIGQGVTATDGSFAMGNNSFPTQNGITVISNQNVLYFINPDGEKVPFSGTIEIPSTCTAYHATAAGNTITVDGSPRILELAVQTIQGSYQYTTGRVWIEEQHQYKDVSAADVISTVQAYRGIESYVAVAIPDDDSGELSVKYFGPYTNGRVQVSMSKDLAALLEFHAVEYQKDDGNYYMLKPSESVPSGALTRTTIYHLVEDDDDRTGMHFGHLDNVTNQTFGISDEDWIRHQGAGARDNSIAIGCQTAATRGSIAVTRSNTGYEPNIHTGAAVLLIGDDPDVMESQRHGIPKRIKYGYENIKHVNATDESIAIGFGSVAAKNGSMIFGQTAADGKLVAERRSLVIGNITGNATASATESSILIAYGNSGEGSSASAGSFAIGDNVNAAMGSVAIGSYSSAEFSSFAVGPYCKASAGARAFGYNAIAARNGESFGYYTTAIAYAFASGMSSTAVDYSLVNGISSRASNNAASFGISSTSSQRAICLGIDSSATSQSLSAGLNNTASNDSSSIGTANSANNASFSAGIGNHTDSSAIAIGTSNTSDNGYGILLGWHNAQPLYGPFTTYGHGILLGSGNTHFGQTASRLVEAAKTCTGYYIVDTGVIIYCDNSIYWGNVTEDEFIGAMSRYFPDRPIKKLSDSVYYWLSGCEYTTVDTDNHVIYYTSYSYSEMGGFSSEAEMLSFLGEMFPSYRTEYSERPKYDYHYMSYLVSYLVTAEGDWNIPVSDEVYMNTMSFIAGTDNTSYGNNNIAIGIKHTVGSATPSDAADPHNDGFATAIGYKCRAVRNYDFAMGYKSTAEGGENIAINQSTAKGYNNLALYKSSTIGTSNMVLYESKLRSTLPNSLVVGNLLYRSDATFEPGSDNSSFIGNTILHAVVKGAEPYSYINYNIFIGSHDKQSDTCDVTIGTQYSCIGNLVTGLGVGYGNTGPYGNTINTTGNIAVPSALSFDRNLIHQSHIAFDSADFITDNIIKYSDVGISRAYVFDRNVMIHGKFETTHQYDAKDSGKFLVDNLIAFNSCATINEDKEYKDDNGNVNNTYFNNNILLFNSKLVASTTEGCIGSYIPCPCNNFLFGSYGECISGCYSFCDTDNNFDSQRARQATILSSYNIVNYGDNYIYRSMISTVFGQSNRICGTKRGFISGTGNDIYYEPDNPDNPFYPYQTYSDGIECPTIIGTDNSIHIRPDSELLNYNYSNVQSYTEDEMNAAIDSGTLTLGTVFKTTGVIHAENSNKFTYLRNGYYYKYSNGMIAEEVYSTRESYVSMEPSTFITGVTNKTLTEGMYYKMTASKSCSLYKLKLAPTNTLLVVSNGPARCKEVDCWTSSFAACRNTIIGARNSISGHFANDSCIVGCYNSLEQESFTITDATEADIVNGTIPLGSRVRASGKVRCNYSYNTTYLTVNKLYQYYAGAIDSDDVSSELEIVSISGDDFIRGVQQKTLSENLAYRVTSNPTIAVDLPTYTIVGDGTILGISNDYCKCFMVDIVSPDTSSSHGGIYDMHITGEHNTATENVYHSCIIGSYNQVSNNMLPYPVQSMFVQGSNNTATSGCNIICMGSLNKSSGHNSVAIGNQLISNQWQTVIGKYNEPIAGPDRLTPGEFNPDCALFIVGNGYGESSESEKYDNESYIHRSNAMVVYADGTVEAKRFVATDEPELALVAGAGLSKEDDFNAGTSTISLDSELAKLLTVMKSRPKQAGKTYMLQSSGEDGELAWVEVGMVDAE